MKAPVNLRSIVARNLKAALVRRRKSVVAVADFAEVSVAHVYDVLGCRKAATVDFIEKLAAALAIEPADLLRKELQAEAPPRPRRRR